MSNQGLILASQKEHQMSTQELAAVDPLKDLQRWASMYLAADIIPADWMRDNNQKRALARIAIILNLANKKNSDPLILLQNVEFIQGHMCWRSTFMLQLLKMAGWTDFQWEFAGDPQKPEFWENKENGCIFSAVNPSTGKRELGTKFAVATVIGEGWDQRRGNKWRTMTEQMFKYRSAAFFCRTNAPEIMGGFYSSDEVRDFVDNTKEDNKKKKEPARKLTPEEEEEDSYGYIAYDPYMEQEVMEHGAPYVLSPIGNK